MQTADSLSRNHLLSLLDAPSRNALAPMLELVPLEVRDLAYGENLPIEHAYFPVEGVISMVATVEGAPDSTIEVATVGKEGMVGLPLFLGTQFTPGRAFAQVPGAALRIGANDFLAATQDLPSFARVLHRYTQALMVQIGQSTACNRVHAAEQRCARWILMTDDRVSTDEFFLTQQFLGQMLGMRRAAVNEVATALQKAGLIRYRRGCMAVVDREALEAKACGCYRVIRDEYARMLSARPMEAVPRRAGGA